MICILGDFFRIEYGLAFHVICLFNGEIHMNCQALFSLNKLEFWMLHLCSVL